MKLAISMSVDAISVRVRPEASLKSEFALPGLQLPPEVYTLHPSLVRVPPYTVECSVQSDSSKGKLPM